MTAAAIKALPLIAALAGALGGDGAAGIGAPTAPSRSQWAEVKWPFPLDQWGTGRAFKCGAANCGVEVNVYVRPKIGFCNCSDGVYDDGELDRVGDLELLGPQFAGRAEGRPVMVGWMKCRSRAFTVEGPYQPRSSALAIAFNDKCDVVVATVTASSDLPTAEREALKFLNGELVLHWAAVELGSS
jgi:hypothetical protein